MWKVNLSGNDRKSSFVKDTCISKSTSDSTFENVSHHHWLAHELAAAELPPFVCFIFLGIQYKTGFQKSSETDLKVLSICRWCHVFRSVPCQFDIWNDACLAVVACLLVALLLFHFLFCFVFFFFFVGGQFPTSSSPGLSLTCTWLMVMNSWLMVKCFRKSLVMHSWASLKVLCSGICHAEM